MSKYVEDQRQAQSKDHFLNNFKIVKIWSGDLFFPLTSGNGKTSKITSLSSFSFLI